MAESRGGRLATLIVTIVLLTLLVAFGSASLALWRAADWQRFRWGLTLTLKIMWGTWLVLFVAALLTHATIVGWKFRKARPGQGPAALLRAIREGITPSAWLKRGPDSFTITVVLVSLTGVAVLATVVLWIINDGGGWFWPSVKIIWGTWWVLSIATVLVRIAIFKNQRLKGGYGPRPPSEDDDKDDEEGGPDQPDGDGGNGPDAPEQKQQPATEKTS